MQRQKGRSAQRLHEQIWSPGSPVSPPAHKCMGFFMYPQDSVTVDYEQLEEQDRRLQRLHLQQLQLPGLRLPDPAPPRDMSGATAEMPASFYQHLPDWDRDSSRKTGEASALFAPHKISSHSLCNPKWVYCFKASMLQCCHSVWKCVRIKRTRNFLSGDGVYVLCPR